MDLGRPVARHLIRRPQEAVEVKPVSVEPAVDEQAADEEPIGTESSDR